MEKHEKTASNYTREELEAARKELTRAEGYIEDPRYKRSNQEAKWGILLGLFNLVLWFVFGYGFSRGPVEEYTYVLGLPLWFFLSCIVTPIIVIIIVFIMTNRMTDMPLEKMTEEEAIEYEAELRRMGK